MRTTGQGEVGGDKSELVKMIPLACSDEGAAVEFLEAQRWGGGTWCPRCGVVGRSTQMRDRTTGERNRRYLWRCSACKQQFTVRIGTVMEDSRIPARFWCLAFYRACASKKGVSALQIKRETGLSYKSALFLMHRVRWAMTSGPGPGELGKGGGIVEADETYVGAKGKKGSKPGRGTQKAPVVAVVERGGQIRPTHMTVINSVNLKAFLKEHVHESAVLMTDEFHPYKKIGKEFGGHETVTHSKKEYVRGRTHTNTVEGFFGLLKRGINGTFHSVSKKHLHRYLDEFAFRYNLRDVDDGERTRQAVRSGEGKRLKYREQIAG